MKKIHKAVESFDTGVDNLNKKILDNDNVAQKKLEELTGTINAEKQRLDKFATTYQNQMNEDKEEFTKMKSNFEKEFEGSQEEWKIASENIILEYKQRFDTYEQQTQNLVGIISGNSFSFRYREVADAARDSAKTWHICAMGLMLAVGVTVLLLFSSIMSEHLSWTNLVAKVFVTTTLGASAAYAARQATKQEEIEKYARKMEMELMTFDPFVASLNEDKRQELKVELVKKIFGRDDVMGMKKDNNEDEIDYRKNLERIIEGSIKSGIESTQ